MVLPADALPFGKGMKRKVISNPEMSQTLAKRKAILGDPMVGHERSLSDDSYNKCERGGSSQSDGSSNGSERGDSSVSEEQFCEGNYEDTQVHFFSPQCIFLYTYMFCIYAMKMSFSQDVSAREVISCDAGVGT